MIKKMLIVASLTLFLVTTVLVALGSRFLEVRTMSYNTLYFEIYSKFTDQGANPLVTISEINKKVEQINPAMKPYLKMIINNAPRPRKGLKVKVFSESYTVYFKNERDWKQFKKMVLSFVSYDQKRVEQVR